MQVVLVWLSAFIVMHAYYFNALMSSERVLFALEVVRALGLEYINQLRNCTAPDRGSGDLPFWAPVLRCVRLLIPCRLWCSWCLCKLQYVVSTQADCWLTLL